MLDIHSQFEVKRLLSPARVADTTAQVSQIIDLATYDGAEIAIAIGTLADADATFDVKLDHGDVANLSDAAEVTAADYLYGTVADFTFAADDTVQQFGYRGPKRYIRLTITPAANSGNADLSAIVILRKKKVGSTL